MYCYYWLQGTADPVAQSSFGNLVAQLLARPCRFELTLLTVPIWSMFRITRNLSTVISKMIRSGKKSKPRSTTCYMVHGAQIVFL